MWVGSFLHFIDGTKKRLLTYEEPLFNMSIIQLTIIIQN